MDTLKDILNWLKNVLVQKTFDYIEEIFIAAVMGIVLQIVNATAINYYVTQTSIKETLELIHSLLQALNVFLYVTGIISDILFLPSLIIFAFKRLTVQR